MPTHKKIANSGFTLIEVMIVIAIMGIIAAIAVPAYNDSVQASRRADCVAVLEEARQGLERFYAKNFTYVGAAAGTDYPNKAPKTGNDAHCTIAADTDATTYTLTATAVGPQVTDKCGDLTITNTGVRTSSEGLSVDECF